MAETSSTRIVTGKVRLSYAHIWKPQAINDGDDPKYSTSLIISKDDTETISKIEAAVKAASDIAKAKNNGKLPPKFKLPLRDGDEEKPDDAAYANSYFLNATSRQKPGVVKKVRGVFHAITDEDEVYSGCYVLASLNFYHFDTKGNRGVAVGLNNLLKVADGEAMAGRASAESDFANVEFDTEEGASGGDLDFLN